MKTDVKYIRGEYKVGPRADGKAVGREMLTAGRNAVSGAAP